MTRVSSSCDLIRSGRRRRGRPKPELPSEGSLARRIYDLLYENRGRYVTLCPELRGGKTRSYVATEVVRLIDFYGCDVIHRKNGPLYAHALIGEWVGKVYLDYTSLAQKEDLKANV